MEEKNIDELLSEEIAAQIKALSDLQSGTKEKSTAIDDLTKLYKLRIEEKSLLETRCSGALTRVYSAIAIEEDVTTASSGSENHTA